MLKTIALAGVTAALVVGSLAVAQTTAPSVNTNNSNMSASTSANGSTTDQNAASANQNATDTAATTGTAGERG